MVLGRDVTTGRPGSAPLLRTGVRVAGNYAGHLSAAGIHAVWIDDDLAEGIVPQEVLSPETRRAAHELTVRALDEAHGAVVERKYVSDRTLSAVQDLAARIAADVVSCAPAALALQDLATADAYTHRHSVQVTVIGLLIAHAYFRRHGWVDARGRLRHDDLETRMSKLGFGLMIHDIGKLAIPAEILNKPGRLTEEEWAIVRAHPLNGLELLPSTTVSALALAVVRSHHERWDGTGYPDGRAAAAIHVFARIASAADVFDAVTSERVYRPAMPPHVGVKVIREGAGSAFDPDVVEAFNEVVMPFPVGHCVTLPDGREGVVVAVDPAEPERPVVRFADGASFSEEPVELGDLLGTPAAAPA
jgi:HD-GYP domain-containing protein (c-di-GMP phosphodiesterase class II)